MNQEEKGMTITLELDELQAEIINKVVKLRKEKLEDYFVNSALFMATQAERVVQYATERGENTYLPKEFHLQVLSSRAVAGVIAFSEVHGFSPPAVRLEIQHEDGVILTGDELFERQLDQYRKLFVDLKQKLERSIEQKRPVFISHEEIGEFGMQIRPKEGVSLNVGP